MTRNAYSFHAVTCGLYRDIELKSFCGLDVGVAARSVTLLEFSEATTIKNASASGSNLTLGTLA